MYGKNGYERHLGLNCSLQVSLQLQQLSYSQNSTEV